MPAISRFLGIVIAMYYDDHQPPHFHARAAGDEMQVAIDPVAVLDGDVPSRGAVLEWAEKHKEELQADWELAVAHQPLNQIPWP
jgi:Domain of unknown function (DUF4160)